MSVQVTPKFSSNSTKGIAEEMPSADSQSSQMGCLSESEEFRVSQTQALEMTEDIVLWMHPKKPASTINHSVDNVLCSVLSHYAPAAACWIM